MALAGTGAEEPHDDEEQEEEGGGGGGTGSGNRIGDKAVKGEEEEVDKDGTEEEGRTAKEAGIPPVCDPNAEVMGMV